MTTEFKAGDGVYVDYPEYFKENTVYIIKLRNPTGNYCFYDSSWVAGGSQLTLAPDPVKELLDSNTVIFNRDGFHICETGGSYFFESNKQIELMIAACVQLLRNRDGET